MNRRIAAAAKKPVSGGAYKTRPEFGVIWDRNPWNGPWCVVRINTSSSRSQMESRQELTDRRGMEFDQCSAPATHSVDGQPHCERHAGQLALQTLLEGHAFHRPKSVQSLFGKAGNPTKREFDQMLDGLTKRRNGAHET